MNPSSLADLELLNWLGVGNAPTAPHARVYLSFIYGTQLYLEKEFFPEMPFSQVIEEDIKVLRACDIASNVK